MSSAVPTNTRPRTWRGQAVPVRGWGGAHGETGRFRPAAQSHPTPEGCRGQALGEVARLRPPPPPACGSSSLGSAGAGRVSRRSSLHLPAVRLRATPAPLVIYVSPLPPLKAIRGRGSRQTPAGGVHRPAGPPGRRVSGDGFSGGAPSSGVVGRRRQPRGRGLSPRHETVKGRGVQACGPSAKPSHPSGAREGPREAEHRPSLSLTRISPYGAGGAAPPRLCFRNEPLQIGRAHV